MTRFQPKNFIFFLVVFGVFYSPFLFSAEIDVLRPAKLSIPPEIKKIFIDPSLIDNTNDKLEIKDQAIDKLKDRLNEIGRFNVFIGPPRDYDPNRETVGIVQGDIISRGEVEEGQFTEKGECRGGLAGFAGTLTADEKTKQGITFSSRRITCRRPSTSSQLVESGITTGLGLLGVDHVPALDEVIRVYQYKNFSLFAQINLSFTQIGDLRKTLAITADAASFSRHIADPKTYRNVRESGDYASRVRWLFNLSPIAPIVQKDIGIAKGSIPGTWFENLNQMWSPDIKDIPNAERTQIISSLISKTISEFLKTISPYKVKVDIEIASGGNSAARDKLENGDFEGAKVLLKEATAPEDLYNLGLATEATAKTTQDFEDALYYYDQAFEKSPREKLYAQGIGRMEYQLKSMNKTR